MHKSKQPRAVVVTRATQYQELLAAHATREQARFFLETRGQSIDSVETQHREFETARHTVLNAIPVSWRRARVSRSDLDRFLFEPDDLVIILGQDGLVANAAKYLDGQPVLGLNPDPSRYEGVLVPLPPEAAGDMLDAVVAGRAEFESRTMVEAKLEDGRRLKALNEIFIGHRSHQSARYRLRCADREERHSSSGVIVSTGTGATGWTRSIHRERACRIELPRPTDARLTFFVREAWPSVATGVELTEGLLEADEELEVVSRMNDGGVIFGDGIEEDRIPFIWGRRATLRLSETRLRLVRG